MAHVISAARLEARLKERRLEEDSSRTGQIGAKEATEGWRSPSRHHHHASRYGQASHSWQQQAPDISSVHRADTHQHQRENVCVSMRILSVLSSDIPVVHVDVWR